MTYLLAHRKDLGRTNVVVTVTVAQEKALEVAKHLPHATRADRVIAE